MRSLKSEGTVFIGEGNCLKFERVCLAAWNWWLERDLSSMMMPVAYCCLVSIESIYLFVIISFRVVLFTFTQLLDRTGTILGLFFIIMLSMHSVIIIGKLPFFRISVSYAQFPKAVRTQSIRLILKTCIAASICDTCTAPLLQGRNIFCSWCRAEVSIQRGDDEILNKPNRWPRPEKCISACVQLSCSRNCFLTDLVVQLICVVFSAWSRRRLYLKG